MIVYKWKYMQYVYLNSDLHIELYFQRDIKLNIYQYTS